MQKIEYSCRNRMLVYLLDFIIFLMMVSTGSADPLDKWYKRLIFSKGEILNDVTYANGIFVAVGEDGIILTSTNGEIWTKINLWTSNDLESVCFGNGNFVVVGWNGTIITSQNGEMWTARNSGIHYNLYGVAYGNGNFIAFGQGQVGFGEGTKLTSQNGEVWTPVFIGCYGELYGGVYGGGTFMIVGQCTYTSSDGTIWIPGFGGNLFAVTYGNGIFVAVGGSDIIIWDGINWFSPENPLKDAWINGIAFGHETFVLVGNVGKIYTSSDGKIMKERTSGIATHLTAVTYGNGTFVAVGLQGIIQSENVFLTESFPVPPLLTGPTSGTINIGYTYSTGGSCSNLDHPVQYLFDWGQD